MSMKNPLTPAGIEPATFRFVAQHLNHCATEVPTNITTNIKIKSNELTANNNWSPEKEYMSVLWKAVRQWIVT